jgi:hypothetical protein
MLTNTRKEYIYKGPDEVWFINSYNKLKRWGINIYTIINNYLRRLL